MTHSVVACHMDLDMRHKFCETLFI